MKAVEDRYGRLIWLANAASATPDWVRQYLPVFDGVTMYANWDEPTQIKLFAEIAPLLHDEFPQKIFEGGIHTTYCVHFHYGGVAPRLTEKYRNSWDITLAAKPDAVTITNWFDTYENSRIMPSYELDDSMLRIAQQRLAGWRGQEPRRTELPDLYVANYTNVLLGQPLRCEVLGFPLTDASKPVQITLELCDDQDAVVHAFPVRDMVLDDLRVEAFEMPSESLARYQALHPRLAYVWNGRTIRTDPFPPTLLVTSLRPHLLFWCRALKGMIVNQGERDWSLNGSHPGETASWPADGLGVISGSAFSNRSRADDVDHGGGWVRILRNGREMESFANWNLALTTVVRLPNPGAALDWYNLELENSNGGRYLSPPVWVSGATRPGLVALPILLESGEVREVEVEAARVPFFLYACDRDAGNLLLDSSGYEHHGYLGGAGYGGGHLARTGYRHEHVGPVPPLAAQDGVRFVAGADERGFLEFSGTGYVMIQGGTAFPYASTWELSVRPTEIGTRQEILGTPNGQLTVALGADGRIEVRRGGALEAAGGARPPEQTTVRLTGRAPVATGSWTQVAIVYDLRHVALYLNGELQQEELLAPSRAHEWINAVVLGGGCEFPYQPSPSFKGGLRQVRIYGRNLRPEEFLRP
jgi:hypothetical protein